MAALAVYLIGIESEKGGEGTYRAFAFARVTGGLGSRSRSVPALVFSWAVSVARWA